MPIEGLKLQMTSDELKQTLKDRIAYHQEKADWLEKEIVRLEPELAKFKGEAVHQGKHVSNARDTNTIDGFKGSFSHHTDRVTLFKFMVEHVIPNETYVLREEDLRKLEVLPSW